MYTHYTVVVAKSCTHFVVVKQLCQVSDDVNIVGHKQPASHFFAQCCYPYVHSQSEKDESGRYTFILLTL